MMMETEDGSKVWGEMHMSLGGESKIADSQFLDALSFLLLNCGWFLVVPIFRSFIGTGRMLKVDEAFGHSNNSSALDASFGTFVVYMDCIGFYWKHQPAVSEMLVNASNI